MKVEKIIKDVIEDYNRNGGHSFDCEQIRKALNNSVKAFETELEVGETYALCMECIYYLENNENFTDANYEGNVEQLVEKFFSQDLEDILAKSEPYKWIPETLEKVLQMSYAIFEEAKEAYFMFGVGGKSDKVDNLLAQMIDARKELNSIEYIYRNCNEILDIYERELSESQLDIDTIKGNKLLLSLRMADYIENSGIDTVNEEVDFSVGTPFSMPGKLFQ